jgi:hypothetical protein
MGAGAEGCAIRWMAVVHSGDVDYVIDIENREFRQVQGRDRAVRFDSEQGWPIARAIIGDNWRKPAGRSMWERPQKGVIRCPRCGHGTAMP